MGKTIFHGVLCGFKTIVFMHVLSVAPLCFGLLLFFCSSSHVPRNLVSLALPSRSHKASNRGSFAENTFRIFLGDRGSLAEASNLPLGSVSPPER